MAGVPAGLLTGLLAPVFIIDLDPGVLAPSFILLSDSALEVLMPGRNIPKGTSSSSSSTSRCVLADSLGLRIFFLKAAADTLVEAEMWSSSDCSEVARLTGREGTCWVEEGREGVGAWTLMGEVTMAGAS